MAAKEANRGTGRPEVGDWLDHTTDVFAVEVGGAKLWSDGGRSVVLEMDGGGAKLWRDGGRTGGGGWELRACATASLAAFWATQVR